MTLQPVPENTSIEPIAPMPTQTDLTGSLVEIKRGEYTGMVGRVINGHDGTWWTVLIEAAKNQKPKVEVYLAEELHVLRHGIEPVSTTTDKVTVLQASIATLTEQLEAKSREADSLHKQIERLKAEASFDADTIRQLQHEIARLQLNRPTMTTLSGDVEFDFIVVQNNIVSNIGHPRLTELHDKLHQGWQVAHINTTTALEKDKGKLKSEVAVHFAHFILQRAKPAETPEPTKDDATVQPVAETVTLKSVSKPEPTPIDPVEPTQIVLATPTRSIPPVPAPPALERDMQSFRDGKASMSEILASWDAQTVARGRAVATHSYMAQRQSPFSPFPVKPS